MNKYKLNSNWCLWYHSIRDNNWNQSSYTNLYTINNIYDIKAMNDTIHKIHLQNGMFFLMRENIFPTWEDPDNRDGCCVSFKISGSGNILIEQWKFMVDRILTEDILIDKSKYDNLNGISISPKREFNILKIWLRNYDENYTDYVKEYKPFFIKENALIKKHVLT